MSTTFEIMEKARTILANAGLKVEDVDCSGDMVTCGTTKKPHGTDGRYRLHMDFPPTLWLCNYHEGGEGQTFPLYNAGTLEAMNEADREALRERIRQEKQAAQEAREKKRQEAAREAKSLWAKCSYATDKNAYLSRKGVVPRGDMMQDADGRLVLPVLNSEGETVSLQFIAGDGEKRFLPGGEKKGCYFPIPAHDGDKSGPLLIGEGVATVLSCCMATGYAGLVAFDAGNLLSVAEVARARYPQREIMVCSDNDCTDSEGKPRGEEQNTGVMCARRAAQAIGAKLAICPAVNGKAADFNDLHTATDGGLELVRECITEALRGEVVQEEEAERSTAIPLPPPAPVEVLPKQLQRFVLHAADAFQVPTSFPLCILLNVCGSLVGATRHIMLKAQWGAYPTLPLVLVAPSGVGKSTMTNYLQKRYLSVIQERLSEQYAVESEEYDVLVEDYFG